MQQSPRPTRADSNFLVPNGTFIVEIIAFLIMLAILGKYVLPRINKALEDRQEQIRSQFEASEKAQHDAAEALEEYKQQLADAREEAGRMREEAREQGAAIIAQMREQAQTEAERITASAHKQIEAERAAGAQLAAHRGGRAWPPRWRPGSSASRWRTRPARAASSTASSPTSRPEERADAGQQPGLAGARATSGLDAAAGAAERVDALRAGRRPVRRQRRCSTPARRCAGR